MPIMAYKHNINGGVMNEVSLFKSLSNPARIRIFRLLLEAGRELCICEIMSALSMTQYNVSKHIRELKIAGLVLEHREGRFVFYSSVRPGNKLEEYIIKAVSSIDENLFADDKKKLLKRLSLRRKGKPVLCIKRCKI